MRELEAVILDADNITAADGEERIGTRFTRLLSHVANFVAALAAAIAAPFAAAIAAPFAGDVEGGSVVRFAGPPGAAAGAGSDRGVAFSARDPVVFVRVAPVTEAFFARPGLVLALALAFVLPCLLIEQPFAPRVRV